MWYVRHENILPVGVLVEGFGVEGFEGGREGGRGGGLSDRGTGLDWKGKERKGKEKKGGMFVVR